MPIPKISGQLTNTNYLSFDGSYENLSLLSGSFNLRENASITMGAGVDYTSKDSKSESEPAIEIKGKYSIGQFFNAQCRFREIGGTEQYRVVFGGSYALDRHSSIYASVHATGKNSDSWKYNTGCWIGATYKFNNGISVSGEFQQNVPLNKTSQSVGKTLGAFDDSNKMFNVNVTIPLN